MSASKRRSFEEEWPSLSSDLSRALRRRGVPPWLTDDIVQETGLRLFKMWDDVDFLRSPRGLALTIAGNLLWDEKHRRAAREILGSIPERPCDQDVERAGLARFELMRVRRAMGHLSPQHRSVLLAEIGDEVEPSGTPAAVKMLRMRARRRLSALLDTASASGIVSVFGLRARLWRAFGFARRQSQFLEMPAAAMAVLAGAVALLIIPTQALPSPRVRTPDAAAPMRAAVQASAEVARLDRSLEAGRGLDAAAGRNPSSSKKADATVDEGESYELIVGDDDGPVQGGAKIEILPDDDEDGEQLCVVEPGENQVSVSCEAEAGGKEYKADATVSLDP